MAWLTGGVPPNTQVEMVDMKPYFDDGEGVVLYHGDCLKVLPSIATGSVNAVVTDPPYNVGFEYAVGDDRKADYREWCECWLGELNRVCSGPEAISVGQANISMWATIAPPAWWLAWWKPAAMGRCVVGFNNWEPIALYGKLPAAHSDVVRAPIIPDPAIDGHPCPKPLAWGIKLVGMLTCDGDTVLDPFAGSGTTLRAAKDLGRKAIGIEVCEAYAEIAAKRLQQRVLF